MTSKNEQIKDLLLRVARLKEANARLRSTVARLSRERQRYLDPADPTRRN